MTSSTTDTASSRVVRRDRACCATIRVWVAPASSAMAIARAASAAISPSATRVPALLADLLLRGDVRRRGGEDRLHVADGRVQVLDELGGLGNQLVDAAVLGGQLGGDTLLVCHRPSSSRARLSAICRSEALMTVSAGSTCAVCDSI